MTELSPLGVLVRRADPDRFFCTLFAPAAARETLFALYALNHELARAREAVREPHMALIRLHWWREVVDGARRRHEVAGPLGEALDAGRLDPATLLAMIDAREAEVDGIPDMAAFEAYALGTAGALMVAAGRALGMAAAEGLRRPGAAYGVAGLRRAELRRDTGRIPDLPAAEAMGRAWLRDLPHVPGPAVAAALPAVLARRDLARPPLPGDRPWTDRVAVTWAGLRGRL
jgi:15-cis-phytoene synthase